MSVGVVHKFPLQTGENKIEMPPGAQLLRVGTQGDSGYVWALIHPMETIKRKLLVVPTGHPFITAGRTYVGTYTVEGSLGQLVWHVFDDGEVST